MQDRKALFKAAEESLGDADACIRLFDGIKEGVRVASLVPCSTRANCDDGTLGGQLVELLIQANQQGVDLAGEVMNSLAARLAAK
ncbi:hypothetical protein N0754_19065 [Pseudomonas aeruginosa]|nr:hypothetical protein [Pseudomonas aeruginosa]MCS9764339.1 hypothetical protein [Pseudomonas aeruginosa]MCS9820515.1 hypothetical protein [Pseudomonas aeruginosa]MCT0241096.1 hypothetical protein [Pseudomonas aeruginosa]MCT0528549.1 hypothetical protein [Pseudomonas aeruginosa]